MPASYAHYRFGKLLLPGLPADVRQCVQRFRRMYDMGLQGPDFFFYYNIFMKTPTGDLGYVFHRQTGQEFFPAACRAATSDAARAYLYGLLGHYCLDSLCHPLIKQLDADEKAKHVPLESEFERFLLLSDGESSPETFNMSKFFRLTRGECMTAAAFYPGVSGGQVFRCVRTMVLCTGILAHPKNGPFLQKVTPQLWEYSIPAADNPRMASYVAQLSSLYTQALERYPRLLAQLTDHLQTCAPFGADFSPDFG